MAVKGPKKVPKKEVAAKAGAHVAHRREKRHRSPGEYEGLPPGRRAQAIRNADRVMKPR